MMDNYRTKGPKKSQPKSRSEQRRQAVQSGKKLPTFTGSKVTPKASPADPHVHLTLDAHKALGFMVTKGKLSRKQTASGAIIDLARKNGMK